MLRNCNVLISVAASSGTPYTIRTGDDVKDGKVTTFIPDPLEMMGTSAAEGVAVDAKGNVYGAEVGPQRLVRHSRQ